MLKHVCTTALGMLAGIAGAQAETLEFTAGGVGGGWYTMASGISALVQEIEPDLVLRTVPGGGVSNPSKIDGNVSQLGFIQSIFGVAAARGIGPFDGNPHDNIRMVLHGLADNYLHMVRPEGDTATIEEILTTGARDIGIARAGSTDEYSFRFVMDYYGTDYETLRSSGQVVNAGYLDLASAFKDGQIDYIFVLLGLPGAMIVDAAQGRAAELVPFDDDLRDALSEAWGYQRLSIPAGTYQANEAQDVPVLVTSTSLYASASVSAETVYRIVRAVCENTDRLASIAAAMADFTCANAAGDGAVPLHPGAERYLREHGFL